MLWVLHSITKTLEAAYLLKTGGWERVKKVSPSSIFFLVHRVGLLKPPELWFLPLDSPSAIPTSLIHLGPRYLHCFWLARLPNFHHRAEEKSIISTALQKKPLFLVWFSTLLILHQPWCSVHSMPECITFKILPHSTRLLSIFIIVFHCRPFKCLGLSVSLSLPNNSDANVIETPGASSGSWSLTSVPATPLPWVQFSRHEASRSSAELSV